MQTKQQTLEGWALRNQQTSSVVRPEDKLALDGLRDYCADTSIIGRGGGASYGDAALNKNGVVADLRGLNRILEFDPDHGVITCEAGLCITDLQAVIVPQRWFLASAPGASQATLGGCVSFDVHGKNHEKQGTFGKNVIRITLLTGSGEVVECGPQNNQTLFWATVGGMGLTGIILEVTLQLIPVETSFMAVTKTKTRNLEETFAAQEKSEAFDYSVTWLDTTARGKSLGRGIAINAHHAEKTKLKPKQEMQALEWADKRAYNFPWLPKRGHFRPLFLKAFNELYYHLPRNQMSIEHGHPFLFPLHSITNINRFYGSNGFYEYQVALPDKGAYELVLYFLSEIQKYRAGSFLTVLKRFGPKNDAPMSFPISGITLSVQILANDPEIMNLLGLFDEKTAKAGGRVYLAKDSRLIPSVLDTMYPLRKNWAVFLDQNDPNHVFTSDLSHRLGLRVV